MPSSSSACQEEEGLELSFRRMPSFLQMSDDYDEDYEAQSCTSPRGPIVAHHHQYQHHQSSSGCGCCYRRSEARSCWSRICCCNCCATSSSSSSSSSFWCCSFSCGCWNLLRRLVSVCCNCCRRRSRREQQQQQTRAPTDAAQVNVDVEVEAGRRWWTRRRRCIRMNRTLWAFWIVCMLVFAGSLVAVCMVSPRWRSFVAVVTGCGLTLMASCMVMLSYLRQTKARRYPNEFFFLVAFCEVALAVKELVYSLYFCLGNNSTDDLAFSCLTIRFAPCSLLNGFTMMLLCASLGWFAAAICHLYASITNPFRDYNAQLIKYHAVIWSSSVAFATATGVFVFSNSSQRRNGMNAQQICQAIQLSYPQIVGDDADRRWRRLNISYWGPLFGLCVAVVLFALVILLIGYWRSKSGTIIALRARRHMMRRMRAYVLTLLACWLVLLVVFGVYWAMFSHVSTVLGDCLHFLIASKGFFTCIMWFGVNDNALHGFLATTCKQNQRGGENDQDHQCSLGTEEALASFTISQQDTIGSNDSLACSCVAASFADQAAHANCEALNNETLQREIVYYTVSGITKAIMQSANASEKTLFQQLLVGNDNDSCNDNDSNVVVEDDGFGLEMSMSSTALLASGHEFAAARCSSPRMYCCNNNNTNINNINNRRGQDLHFNLGITANGTTGTNNTNVLQPDANPLTTSGSFTSRFSLYPVSQVPFELFENELELHSHHSHHSLLQSTHSIGVGVGSGSGAVGSSSDGTNNLSIANLPVSSPPSWQLSLQTSFEEECQSPITSPKMPPKTTVPHTSCARAPSKGLSRLQRAATFSFKKRNRTNRGNRRLMQPKVFVDYAPNEFRQIRQAFGIYDGDYLASFRTTAKERVSAGSSGAFMFFSGDNALIVKSLRPKECRKLVAMVPKYLDFILNNPRSRLIRFFGCHRICLYGRNFYFAVMANVLHSNNHCATIAERYDIKGSFVDRQAKLPQPGDLVTCSECCAKYLFRDATASKAISRATTTTNTTMTTMALGDDQADTAQATRITSPVGSGPGQRALNADAEAEAGALRITSPIGSGAGTCISVCVETPKTDRILPDSPTIVESLQPPAQASTPTAPALSRLYLPLTGHVHQPDVILKDLDLRRRFHLSESTARSLYAQLVADSDFLCAMGIMDYSLLIGVHKCQQEPPLRSSSEMRSSTDSMPIPLNMLTSFRSSLSMLSSLSTTPSKQSAATQHKKDTATAGTEATVANSEHLAPFGSTASLRRWQTSKNEAATAASDKTKATARLALQDEYEEEDEEEVYFIGIIDVLQQWDLEKRLERFVKIALGKPHDGISAIEPVAYRRRFQAKLREILEINRLDLI